MDAFRAWFVGRWYAYLQGMRYVPLIVLLIVSPLWIAGWIRLPGDENPVIAVRWFVVGLCIAAAASYAVLFWYQRAYGVIRQRIMGSPTWLMVAGIVGLPIALDIQQRLHLHFAVTIAWIGALVAVRGITQYPLRRHYLAAAAVLFAFVVVSPPLDIPTRRLLLPIVLAVALGITAIGDHLLIATTHAAEREPEDV